MALPTWSINWGDGSATQTAGVDPNNSSSATTDQMTFNHSFPTNSTVGYGYFVLVTAVNDQTVTQSQFYVECNRAQAPSGISIGGEFSGYAGYQSPLYEIAAPAGGDPVTINWGDRSPDSTYSSDPFTTHVYQREGDYLGSITFSDGEVGPLNATVWMEPVPKP